MEYSRCRPHPIPGERWTLAAYQRQMAHLVKTEQQAALLSVRGNRLSACVCAGPSGPAALTSKLALEWLVSLWREALQPGADFSVIAALHDFVTPQLQAAAPVYSIEQGPNRVSLPTFNTWRGGWTHETPRNLTAPGATPREWSTRKSQLVWRGSVASYGGVRSRLLTMAQRHPRWIDARGTDGAGGSAARLTLAQQESFKYTINMPGLINAYAWRTPELFLRGFLVFHVRDGDVPFWRRYPGASAEPEFMCQLRPFIHYIPLNASLGSLLAQLEWAMAHDDVARAIAQRGRAAMLRLLEPSRLAHTLTARVRAAPFFAIGCFACPPPHCKRTQASLAAGAPLAGGPRAGVLGEPRERPHGQRAVDGDGSLDDKRSNRVAWRPAARAVGALGQNRSRNLQRRVAASAST